MTADERERLEGADIKEELVQKMESYLRERYDGKSAEVAGDAMERLLWQVGKDWLINRGLPASEGLLREATKEAATRYRSNWNGKVQGEDDRSNAFGRILSGGTKNYTV